MTDDLVARLREAHQTSQQRVVGSNIFAEAADCLEVERAARAKAEGERDDASKALENLLDPKVQSMRLENGKLNVALCGEVVQRLALIVTGWFRESGAKNYVEMTLNARDEPFERYTFTVQKRGDGAQSPHELRLAAEARVRELEAENRRMAERLGLLAVGFGVPDGGRYIADWQTKIDKFKAAERQLAEAYERAADKADELSGCSNGYIATVLRNLAQEVKHETD